jgi:anti-sigma regulatory factor (Ser/Thr protein kinase)
VKNKFAFKIANNLTELGNLCTKVNQILQEADIGAEPCYAINLALEEMGTNIIKYGYDDNDLHEIEMKLELGSQAVLTLVDDGHEFDPFSAEVTDLSTDIAQRSIGGMGIHLTKSMSESMEYHRTENKNRLRITINLNK